MTWTRQTYAAGLPVAALVRSYIVTPDKPPDGRVIFDRPRGDGDVT